jgi:hypothetical protein
LHVIERDLWQIEAEGGAVVEIGGGSSVPTKVSLRYFDPSIDFAASEKSARLPGVERLKRIELPAAITGERAKAAAFEQLARPGREASSGWITLPLSFANIALGDRIASAGQPEKRFRVCAKLLRAGELRLHIRTDVDGGIAPLASDTGGVPSAPQLARRPLNISLLELPSTLVESGPELAVLVSGGHDPFQPLPVTISSDGFELKMLSSARPSPEGRLLSPLPDGPADLIDMQHVLTVEFDDDPELTSCNEAFLLAGANLIWINGEFVRFGIAEPLGPASYKLRELVRGCYGSEATFHSVASPVQLLSPGAFQRFPVPRDRVGAIFEAQVHGPDGASQQASLTLSG